jgi:hypothetical protein
VAVLKMEISQLHDFCGEFLAVSMKWHTLARC